MIELKIQWCDYATATYAVRRWHYSRVMPTPPYNLLGAWEEGRFIGVVVFSRGAAPRGPEEYGLSHTECCELTRVALYDHRSHTSRVVSIAVKMMSHRCPGIRLIVSYADPAQGHNGGIYQAMGWIFVGQRHKTIEYIGPDKKQWHGRMISSTGRKKVYGRYRQVWRPSQCTPVECPGKNKYLKPMDRDMRSMIIKLSKPYPKRAGSIASDAAAIQADQGGATPTSALIGAS